MKKFGLFVLVAGSLLVACTGATDPEDKTENGDEPGPSSSALEEILVTDWEAEGNKENGPTKKILPRVGLPAAGFYKSVEIPVPSPTTEGGVVRCTFGGDEPTASTDEMTAPVTVDSSMVVRCKEFLQDSVVASATETYFIGESVAMPVVAVTVPNWYYKNILKADPCKPDPCSDAAFWLDTAVTAHVEYFAEGSSSIGKGFEIDAEASIMGGYSRNQKKKSVSFKMKKDIQKGHFRYPLFDTRAFQKKFKGFILRNNGNRFVSDYLEDAMGTSLLEGTQVDYQRSRQVVVFYNGHYYGIHDMREKLNEHFVETNYGIDAGAVDFVKHTNMTIEASGGTIDDYVDLLNYISASDFTGENNEAYKIVKSRVNMQSLMEYLAAEIYYHNGDWPDNNLRAWRSGTQKWKFVAFDLDHGFDWEWGVKGFSQSTNMFSWIKTGGITTGSCYKNESPLCFHNVFNKLNTNP
ncbi:MAG: CotH kinase family protein, partial [Fibrobacter sp.]|nr:CotH kinase family protein [Fibrobacter sp.]